eukprot:1152281-Pelagomonas_calceolata.AAC.7
MWVDIQPTTINFPQRATHHVHVDARPAWTGNTSGGHVHKARGTGRRGLGATRMRAGQIERWLEGVGKAPL